MNPQSEGEYVSPFMLPLRTEEFEIKSSNDLKITKLNGNMYPH